MFQLELVNYHTKATQVIFLRFKGRLIHGYIRYYFVLIRNSSFLLFITCSFRFFSHSNFIILLLLLVIFPWPLSLNFLSFFYSFWSSLQLLKKTKLFHISSATNCPSHHGSISITVLPPPTLITHPAREQRQSRTREAFRHLELGPPDFSCQ